MQKSLRFLAIVMTVLMLGTISVSANQYDTMLIDDSTLSDTTAIAAAPVYVTIEGPEEPYTIMSGVYPIDGSWSAADVTAHLLNAYYPGSTIEMSADGTITSVDGIANGMFGGEDGWHFVVKYYVPNLLGLTDIYLDVPTVSPSEYAVTNVCSIVLYYGDADDAIVNLSATAEGKLQINQCTAIFAENGTLAGFDVAPLPYGEFVMIDAETKEEHIFIADENGVLELSVSMTEVPNGAYVAFAGKQSDESVTIDGVTITKPEVVRHTDIYYVIGSDKMNLKRKITVLGMS